MTEINHTALAQARAEYLSDADKAEDDAGHGGYHHDGGAARMRERIQAFYDGYNRTIPKFLEPYYTMAIQTQDPEWETYQRLRKKFSGNT